MLTDAISNVRQLSRRAFFRRTLTLGGLALLAGCKPDSERNIESALMQVSKLNDYAQGWLFDPEKLAPTYPDSMITRPFPFNAYYGEADIPQVDRSTWELELSGLIADRTSWRL